MGRELLVLAIAALVGGCVSVSPKGDEVRVTSNPEVIRGCKFLGNVRATSGWGNTGLAESNTIKTLRNKTAKLGGNVVFVAETGQHAEGEAYQCPSE